jgi:hypothetical protein
MIGPGDAGETGAAAGETNAGGGLPWAARRTLAAVIADRINVAQRRTDFILVT